MTAPQPLIGVSKRRGRFAASPLPHADICAVVFGVLLLSSGCSQEQLDGLVKKSFVPGRTPQQEMLVAVSDSDPDLRRTAIAKVAKSKAHEKDWAIKGYIAIALLETNAQARCVAIRALTRTGDPRACETLLKIMTWREQPPQEVRPPDDLSRWDATLGLAALALIDHIPPAQKDAVKDVFLDRLAKDSSRHVRAAAANGLGFFPCDESVKALIAGIRDQDFSVVYACEDSLVRLTGVTQHCNAEAWDEWYEANQTTLLAHAGEIPESRRLPYNGKLEKSGYQMKLLYNWLFPPKKEN